MLNAGTRIGPYEIVAAIGAGGMGEVYRARDPKLGRDVAIKVLAEAFAGDASRMARFQREAKVLASLSHPNIASIYGLEDSGTSRALVMELVEGPTLADRIKHGPIPVDEAVRIARQIADALEYAHEHGIIHRDLKPANIEITADDTVKVLDFGLAKALEGDTASIDISTSPTISRMATQQGILLGTAAYMSPEQAKAKPVDRRADVWAFGCVLYEMLTGKRAFTGDTVTDTLASVIKEEPNWSQLPAATPIRVRVLLQRCLQKDVRQRLQAMGEARIALDEVLSGAPDAASSAGVSPALIRRRAIPWALLGAMTIAFAIVVWAPWRAAPTPASSKPMRFQIPLPEKMTFAWWEVFALSPDGHELAFSGVGADGVHHICVRALDSLGARPLPGTETSTLIGSIFWSPDSRFIAVDTHGKLEKMSVSGGPPETICDLSEDMRAIGGSWNGDGVIIFGQSRAGLMRVPASGGSALPLTSLDRSRNEILHSMPSFLPDGRHFLYLRVSSTPENTGIYVGSLDAKPEQQNSKRLLATHYWATYVPSSDFGAGHLLFLRDGTLLAQVFDTRRLELVGDPVPVAEQVGSYLGYGFFSASTPGALVYRSSSGASQLTWFDRQGRILDASGGEPGAYDTISLSPDGKQAAVSRSDNPLNPSAETLWLFDFSRGTSTRFTFGPSLATLGTWSPDGSRIVFASRRGGALDLYQKLASGVNDEEVLLKSSDDKWPTSWSRDGRFLLYQASAPNTETKGEVWVLPLVGDKKPFPFLRNEFNNDVGQFSPDGRWVAYFSNESGRNEVYVRTFSPESPATTSSAGGKWLISTGGGSEPRWRGDGKELYYLTPDGTLMAVEITTNPVFRAGVPKPLFQAPPHFQYISENHWDVTPDGKRFLFAARNTQAPFTVVLNWQSLLKK